MKFLSYALLTLLVAPKTLAVVCGNVKEMTGRVEILRIVKGEESLPNPARNAVLATENFELDCTDIVVTTKGARAVLKFNKASISMSSNSRISVMQYSKKTGDADMLNLTYGRLRVFFDGKEKDGKTPTKDDIKFRVKTPTAVAGVRGTDFYTSFDPEPRVTEQATITGKVEVTQRGSNQKVMVDAGKQVEIPNVKGAEVMPEVPAEKAMAVEEVKPQEIAKRLELKAEPIKPSEMAKVDAKEGEKVEPKAEEVKPLEVKPIEADTVKAIRDASAIAKNEKVFTSEEAVKILGKPNTWVPMKEGLPEELKGIKNEF